VDAAGTAYIAWSGPENPASLQFCRLPRGATACDVAHAIVAPGTTTSRAFVTVSGSRVTVVQYRYPVVAPDVAGVYAFISTNGGRSFDAGRIVGTIPFYEAVIGPGNTMTGATDAHSGGMLFQKVPLDGSSAAGSPSTQLSGLDHPYRGTVGLVDAATPLTVFTSGSDAARYRRYDGSGSLNDAANWAPAADLGVASYPKLAGGPSGLFLLATAADNTVFARKWNGTTFAPPVAVTGGAGAPTLHAFQDPGGRLHAVFARGDANGLHLIHAVSDHGTTWRSGTAVTQRPPTGIADTRVATAPDHVGVAVLQAGNPVGEIRVAAVGPDAPVDAAPAPIPTPEPPPVVKRKPSITGTGSAKRVRSKVRLRISAKLVLPSGVSEAAGCNGTVKVSIARRKKVIASKTVKVRSTCKFGLKTKLKRSKVKRAKRLSVIFRFSGNDVLTPVKRTGSIKVK
jgi:hypothetical protein